MNDRNDTPPEHPEFGQVGFGEFTPDRGVGPCVWPHLDVLTVHDGELDLRLGDHQVLLGAGESVLIYPQTPFSGRTVTPRTWASVVHLALPASEAAVAMLPAPLAALVGLRAGFRRARLTQATLEQDIPRLVDQARRRQSADRDARLLALATLLLASFSTTGGDLAADPRRERLAPAIQRLQSDLLQPPTVAELAGLCHLSESHFRAEFRAVFGDSPQAFAMTLRMNEATRQLRETQRPIKQVAQAVGFRRVKDFYRAFAQRYDDPPAQYRRRHSLTG